MMLRGIFPDTFSAYALGIVVAGGLAALAVVYYVPPEPTAVSMEVPIKTQITAHLNAARAHILTTYDVQAAERSYLRVLALDPGNEEALYELARVLLVTGDYARGTAYATRFANLYPAKPRILYVQGLLAGYDGKPELAEQLLTRYIAEAENTSWQSRLDLSWALFQQGKFSAAYAVLKDQVAAYPHNPWLLNNAGVALLGMGNHAEARTLLSRAVRASAVMTDEEWQKNYSFNNPADREETIQLFKDIIAYNAEQEQHITIASAPPEYKKLGALSPSGIATGIAVSACGESCGPVLCTSPANACGQVRQVTINTCINPSWSCAGVNPPYMPAGYGQSCTGANQCGVVGTGTVGCSGSCEASAGMPNGFGTGCIVQTQCGPAHGRINCNGQCNVVSYATATNGVCDQRGLLILGDENDEELDAFGNRVPKYGCTAAKVKIKALPLLVRKGKVSAIQWLANEAVSCTVNGGGQTWTGLQGVQITSSILETTKFTITCQPMPQCTGQNALPFSASVEVKVVPDWQEI